MGKLFLKGVLTTVGTFFYNRFSSSGFDMEEAHARGAKTLQKIQSAQTWANSDYSLRLRIPWNVVGMRQDQLPQYLGASLPSSEEEWCGEICKNAGKCVLLCEVKAIETALRYRVLRDNETCRVEEAGIFANHNQWQSILVCGTEVWPWREDESLVEGDVRVSWGAYGIEVKRSRFESYTNNKAYDFATLTTLLAAVDFSSTGAVLGTWDTAEDKTVLCRMDAPTIDWEEYSVIEDHAGIVSKRGEDLSIIFPKSWLTKEGVVLKVESEWAGAGDNDELDGQHLRRLISLIVLNEYGGDVWGRLVCRMQMLADCVRRVQASSVTIDANGPCSSTCGFLLGGPKSITHGQALAFTLAFERVRELTIIPRPDGRLLELRNTYTWHLPDRVVGAVYKLRDQVSKSRRVTGRWAVLVCEDNGSHEDCRAILLPGQDLAAKYGLEGPAQCAVILNLAQGTVANATFVGKRSASGDVVLPNDGGVWDMLVDYWRSGRFKSSSPRGDWFDWIHEASASECFLAIVITLAATVAMLVADSGVFHFIAAFFLNGICQRESHLVTLWSAIQAVFKRDTRKVGRDLYGHTALLVTYAMVEIFHELQWGAANGFGVVVGAWWIIGWICTIILVRRKDDVGSCMIMRPLTGGPWGVTESRPLLLRESEWLGYFGRKGCRCTEVDSVQIAPYGLGPSDGSTTVGEVGHCEKPVKWANVSEAVLCAGLVKQLMR